MRSKTRPLDKAPSLKEVAAIYEDSVGGSWAAAAAATQHAAVRSQLTALCNSGPRGSGWPCARMQRCTPCMKVHFLASRRLRLQDVPAAVPRHIFHEVCACWQALQLRPPYLHMELFWPTVAA